MNRQAKAQSAPADTLRITRIFAAPRALVYRMWTEKHLMDRWSCPNGFTMPDSGADLRPGGRWHATMRTADGVNLQLQGTYREIVPDERLVFTHAWLEADGKPGPETLITVTFAEEAGKTRLTFEQGVFETVESRDSHLGGWSQFMDSLARYLATA